MAKVTLGPMVTDIARSIGTVTFERGQHGLYSKTRKGPDQTLTPARTAARAAWSAAAQSWSTALTDAQRTAWANQAPDRSISHQRIGDTSLLPFCWFSGRNALLAWAGAPMLTDPPADDSVTQISTLSLSNPSAPPALAINFTPSPVPGGHAIMVWATPPQNPGRMSANSARRLIHIAPAGTASPVDITANYVPRFGNPAAGRRVFAFANLLNLTNGVKSIRQQANVLLTTGLDIMLQSTTEITSAQILALSVNNINLLPAPGAGYLIRPIFITVKLHAGAIAYTGGGNLVVSWGNPSAHACVTFAATALVDNASDTTSSISAGSLIAVTPVSCENQPLAIGTSTAQTLGTGTLTVTTDYAIDPTT